MFYFYRCDGKSKCVVSVDSMSFHDACPGTLKYLEIHYACHSRSHKEIPSDSRKPPGRVPQVSNGRIPKDPNKRIPKGPSAIPQNTNNMKTKSGDKARSGPKVPILVTARATIDSDVGKRVPITTPSTTTSTPTTVTTTKQTTQKMLDTESPKNVNSNKENNRNFLTNQPGGMTGVNEGQEDPFPHPGSNNGIFENSRIPSNNVLPNGDFSIKSGKKYYLVSKKSNISLAISSNNDVNNMFH